MIREKGIRIVCLVLCAAMLLCGCRGVERQEEAEVQSAVSYPMKTVVSAEELKPSDYNNFALELFRRYAVGNGNAALYPAVVAEQLEMLRSAAEGSGAAEIDHALGVSCEGEELTAAAADMLIRSSRQVLGEYSAWASRLVLAEGPTLYEKRLEMADESFATSVDFCSLASERGVETINDWVSAQTNGHINEIVTLLPEGVDDRATLLSAMTFAERWKTGFPQTNTVSSIFKAEDGSSQTAQMMASLRQEMRYTSGEVSAAFVPMENGNMETWLLLPPGETELQEFIGALTLEKLVQWRTDASYQEYAIQLPKVDLLSAKDITANLKSLGVREIFDPLTESLAGWGSDFSLSAMYHASCIHLGEEGSLEAEDNEEKLKQLLRTNEGSIKFDRPFVVVVVDIEDFELMFLGAVKTVEQKGKLKKLNG